MSNSPSGPDPRVGPRRCVQCGLANFAVNDTCRRCGAVLTDARPDAGGPVNSTPKRGIGRRLPCLAGVIVVIIFGWSRSLLLTSEPINANLRPIVTQSVMQLEHAGFSNEVLVLRHFANYRATDNWWNEYLGHQEAYAASNFPLGVLTLYPPFFTMASDDTERAVILLHEAQHLLGSGEEAALDRVWREKSRIGWTAERYGGSKVWKNVREWTAAGVPALFECGADRHADCIQ